MNIELQPRDWLTLEPLVYSYRLTTPDTEAKRHSVNVRTSQKRLDRLHEGRILNRLSAWVSDIPNPEPLVEWHFGYPPPDFGKVAYEAQVRWQDRPIRKTTVYTASNKLLALFALPPRPHIKLHHATHDLGVAAAFFYCEQRWPHLRFVGEDVFANERGHGEGVEDAQLFDGEALVAVVEYAGSYRRDRVEHFHDHVSERELSYYLF